MAADRDRLGRYYNFPSREKLTATYGQAGDWASVAMEEGQGGGFDGVPRTFLCVTAIKA